MGIVWAPQEPEPSERVCHCPIDKTLQILTTFTATCRELSLSYAQAGQNSYFLQADTEVLPIILLAQALLGRQGYCFREERGSPWIRNDAKG